jgi:hypothetical protein
MSVPAATVPIMGYDTSFHPVDLSLVEGRLLPYVAGHGPDDALDDLVARAVRIRRARFRAKAWALGVLKCLQDQDAGAGTVPFDPYLHVWGRPFFIVGDDVARVAEDVRRYLAAATGSAAGDVTPEAGVDALAVEMAARLDPALPARVQPDTGGRLPGDDALADHLAGPLRILRRAALALRAGEPVIRHPANGRELDAARLLEQEVPFQVLDFAAALLPGWMSRGTTWPTYLCADAGLTAPGFTTPSVLTGLLRTEFPHLGRTPLPATITGNYTVGGLLPADRVPAARAHLSRHAAELDCAPVDLRKLDEALGVAEILGTAFCEATEIYSGLEGNLN